MHPSTMQRLHVVVAVAALGLIGYLPYVVAVTFSAR